ncbi:hypothetical protein T439DRAFT_359682 [Meredithblackwellia eburnea MCA 4105]
MPLRYQSPTPISEGRSRVGTPTWYHEEGESSNPMYPDDHDDARYNQGSQASNSSSSAQRGRSALSNPSPGPASYHQEAEAYRAETAQRRRSRSSHVHENPSQQCPLNKNDGSRFSPVPLQDVKESKSEPYPLAAYPHQIQTDYFSGAHYYKSDWDPDVRRADSGRQNRFERFQRDPSPHPTTLTTSADLLGSPSTSSSAQQHTFGARSIEWEAAMRLAREARKPHPSAANDHGEFSGGNGSSMADACFPRSRSSQRSD